MTSEEIIELALQCGIWIPLASGSEREQTIDNLRRFAALVAAAERDTLRAAVRHEADCVEACKSEIERLRAKLEAAEKTNREWLRANAPGGWIDNLRIENEALRAEVIHIKEVEFPRKAQAVADGWRSKCEHLEAKIAEMEQQEPVAWYSKQYGFVYMSRHSSQFEHGSILYLRNGASAWRIEGSSKVALLDMASLPHGTVFYTLPGAQTQGEEK